jgi:hypothetical protein
MEVTEEETMYGYYMQDNAVPNIANFSMTALEKVFDIWWISCGLWFPISPDFKLKYLLWGTFSFQDPKGIIQREVASI